uniref:Uncharacterized protein n=1 Tax=Arundo donax TaxID=35708 RepID=A0A0A9CWH6_ARUDO
MQMSVLVKQQLYVSSRNTHPRQVWKSQTSSMGIEFYLLVCPQVSRIVALSKPKSFILTTQQKFLLILM